MAIFDTVVAVPASSSSPRGEAVLFLFREQQFQRQARMRKNRHEMNQVEKQIEQRFAARAVSRGNDWAIRSFTTNQVRPRRQRLDDPHVMKLQQIRDLATQGPQRGLLHLDQFRTDDGIDAIPGDRHLLGGSRHAIKSF